MNVPDFCVEKNIYPSCLVIDNKSNVTRFCSNYSDACPRFSNPMEWEKAQSILLGTQSEVCLMEFTKNTPTLIDEKDVIDTFERFCPTIISRQPNENSDNYRELLPKELWEHYPPYMRAYLLDSGRLKVSELGSPEIQLQTIRYLKSKRQWNDFPLILKLCVFFGYETVETLKRTEKKIKEEIQDKSLRHMEEEDLELRFRKREYELKEKAKKEARRLASIPKSEKQFFEEILDHQIKEMMKNEQ